MPSEHNPQVSNEDMDWSGGRNRIDMQEFFISRMYGEKQGRTNRGRGATSKLDKRHRLNDNTGEKKMMIRRRERPTTKQAALSDSYKRSRQHRAKISTKS